MHIKQSVEERCLSRTDGSCDADQSSKRAMFLLSTLCAMSVRIRALDIECSLTNLFNPLAESLISRVAVIPILAQQIAETLGVLRSTLNSIFFDRDAFTNVVV